ncbi:hypothetical protein [Streptomyces avicenniae]|uniref:hypothetical protein n=1 Tax=Streptomyces avicenniae TaxID=500153 RepID=UPI00069ADD5D|nr:hypothetical protein [Streptomyces avicenniae]
MSRLRKILAAGAVAVVLTGAGAASAVADSHVTKGTPRPTDSHVTGGQVKPTDSHVTGGQGD